MNSTMKTVIFTNNSHSNQSDIDSHRVTRLFKSWLALGLLLNLGLGQLQLPIGPLWLWLVLIPALCVIAVPGALAGFGSITWLTLPRLGLKRGRAQARRRPTAQA